MVAFLGGDDSAGDKCSADPTDRNKLAALREKISTEKSLLVLCGPELHGEDIASLVRATAALVPDCRWVCLGDYANSHGASDMGLYPDLLPGHTPVSEGIAFREKWDAQFPTKPGLNLLQILEACKDGLLTALYVVGSNPVDRYHVDPFALRAPFLVVQDLFLTETAQLANFVLPATSAYEKSGTFTNTCGDLQSLKKAAEVAGPKSDLEIIARIAQYMGYPIEKLVRRGEGIRADAGQSRGAQSGEVDRQAVWTERQDLEPRLGPFDPDAVLDEIRSLVPVYRSRHVDFSGLKRLVLNRSVGVEEKLITSSKDDLFSSGSLGRYCSALTNVMESHILLPYERDSDDRELIAEAREWNDPGSVRPGS